ncbi:hypothetical protein ACET3Z_001691 [Daucus carota]
MVRTRSGVEVRIVQKRNDEDEIVIEDDNAGEDDGVDASDGEDESRNNGEETLENLYNVELYYGGHFVHVPYESYTSNVKRVYKNVDLEKLSIDELKSCFKGPVGEFDSLFFRSPELKIYLLNAESKPVLIELSKNCGNVVKLYVYHMPTPSLIQLTSTGCTPPASTPPTVGQPAKKKTPRKSVKSFAPPRPKKQ